MSKVQLIPMKTPEQELQELLALRPDLTEQDFYDAARKLLDYNARPDVHADKHCPVCGTRAAWNRRSISGKQARALINLYNCSQPGEYKHIGEFASQKGDGDEIAKMRFFGFAEPMENDDKTKTHSGMWCLTNHGRMFVEGRITVAKYVWVYRSKLMGFEGEQVSLGDCLGRRFDVRETRPGFREIVER